jgi:sulfite reductase alpha subunit-like flavoprotein
VLLEPKWLLDFVEKNDDSAPRTVDEPSSSVSEVPPDDLLDIPGGLTAKINSNQRLTPEKHWQDVRHVTFDLSGHRPYTPGDVITIYPKNFPTDVSQLIATMGWTSIADRPLHFVSSSPSATRLPIQNTSRDTTITLRTLLTNHLDIMSIPRRSFFAHIAHFTDDTFHRDRLLEFTNPEYIDELYDYTTRPRRSILEVLQEFESVKIPWQRICSVIPAIRGRQFSIASAMTPSTAGSEEGTRVELLIAIVKYKTVIKKIREGVCTRYVSSLRPGQSITVTLQKGGLGVTKKEMGKPVVMIGPGTGIAPMRALIYQREWWRQEAEDEAARQKHPKDLLFFGCRNAESDYFFKDEWESLQSQGVPLDVFTAFSRDQVRSRTPSSMIAADGLAETKSIRPGPRSPAKCTYIRGARGFRWHSVPLRLFRKDATSGARGAHRRVPERRKYGTGRSRGLPHRHGEERAIQTGDMVELPDNTNIQYPLFSCNVAPFYRLLYTKHHAILQDLTKPPTPSAC